VHTIAPSQKSAAGSVAFHERLCDGLAHPHPLPTDAVALVCDATGGAARRARLEHTRAAQHERVEKALERRPNLDAAE
jgi:hypothetical protein